MTNTDFIDVIKKITDNYCDIMEEEAKVYFLRVMKIAADALKTDVPDELIVESLLLSASQVEQRKEKISANANAILEKALTDATPPESTKS